MQMVGVAEARESWLAVRDQGLADADATWLLLVQAVQTTLALPWADADRFFSLEAPHNPPPSALTLRAGG